MNKAKSRHFAMIVPGSKFHQTWCVEDSDAYRVGVPNAKAGKNTYLKLDSKDQLLQQFEDAFPCWPGLHLEERLLAPGEYYGRIARPIDQHPAGHGMFPAGNIYKHEIANTVGQLTSLVARFRDVCRVVEPDSSNFSAYGYSIRELLILSAMEVESHCKAVLRANGIAKPRLYTKDYIKVLPAMKLDEYAISFIAYPNIKPIRPFEHWDAARPTKSLPFYDSYNSVKHDRESMFHAGTLEHTLNAIAACMVMAIAQFGYGHILSGNRALSEFFKLDTIPAWPAGETYTSATDEWVSTQVNYSF